MNVERVLSRYKRSCLLHTPTAERFSSAGFLSEWNSQHVLAGGQDTKVTHARDLIKDYQAPLKAARTSRNDTATAGKQRGNMLFACETQSKHAESPVQSR